MMATKFIGKHRIRRLILALSFAVAAAIPFTSGADAADSWPADSGAEIHNGGEPSGIVWHERLERLFWVHDNGYVYRMDTDGTIENSWSPGSDIEGIAIADSDTNYVYLGIERSSNMVYVREFDISTGALTGKSWRLTEMEGHGNAGLEALTFVPNGYHPYSDSSSGGLFYAGLQADGRIYVYDLDLSSGGTLTYIDVITPVAGRGDLAGLHFQVETATLYAVYDGSNLLREIGVDGTYVTEYVLPGANQEGVTLVPSCPTASTEIYIAEDSGRIMEYSGYPVTCADSDGDGLGDAEETATYGTGPFDADSDDDGYSDCVEVAAGSDALVGSSVPDTVSISFQPADAARLPTYAPDTSGLFDADRGYGWGE